MEQIYCIIKTTHDEHDMMEQPLARRDIVAVCETQEVADIWIMDHMRSMVSGQEALMGQVIVKYAPWQIQLMFNSFEVESIDYYEYGSL